MAIQSATTTNFQVFWDDAIPERVQGAGWLLASCENDLTRLSALIGPPGALFGPGNRIQLVLGDPPGVPGAVGSNTGYQTSNGTYLWVNPKGYTAADNFRSLMVMELAEILNSAWPKPSGFPTGSSISEGLSKTMAPELYPGVLEGPGFLAFPSVWLNNVSLNALGEWQRTDWVNATFPSETDTLSTACAMLFLNYLRYQLFFTWKQIMTAGGDTLAETYRRLTGKTTGWQDFSQLLLEHMPPSAAAPGARGITLQTHNPFPLLPYIARDGLIARGANQSQGRAAITRPWLWKMGVVHIKACPFIDEAKDYIYMQVRFNETITVTLDFYGFAFPYMLSWSVKDPATGNDVELASADPPVKNFTHGIDMPIQSKGAQTLTVNAGVENPADPGSFTYSTQPVGIEGTDPNIPGLQISFPVPRSFAFKNDGYPGTFSLEFSADVCETHVPDQVTRITGFVSFKTIDLVMDGNYISDRNQCSQSFWNAVKNYVRVAPYTVLPPLPDPPPGWREAIAWVAQVRKDLAARKQSDPKGVAQAARLLAQHFGVNAEEFLCWGQHDHRPIG